MLRLLVMNESIKRLSNIITTGMHSDTDTHKRKCTINLIHTETAWDCIINVYSLVVCNSEDGCSAAERVMAGRVYYYFLLFFPLNCNVILGGLKTRRQIRFWHKGRNGGVASSFVMTYWSHLEARVETISITTTILFQLQFMNLWAKPCKRNTVKIIQQKIRQASNVSA